MRRISATIYQLRHATARLRHASAGVGLLLLLTLGVLEPLACIIHCELTARAASHAAHESVYLCAFMQHGAAEQTHTGPAFAAVPSGPVHAMFSHARLPGESSVPSGAGQPQPFHEMALVAVALLIIASIALHRSILPSMAPPQRFIRPPLRPPTQFHSFA